MVSIVALDIQFIVECIDLIDGVMETSRVRRRPVASMDDLVHLIDVIRRLVECRFEAIVRRKFGHVLLIVAVTSDVRRARAIQSTGMFITGGSGRRPLRTELVGTEVARRTIQ